LDLVLHGNAMRCTYNDAGMTTVLPTVERVKAAFPEMVLGTAQDFCATWVTPNKEHWILGIKPSDFHTSPCFLENALEALLSISDDSSTESSGDKFSPLAMPYLIVCLFPPEDDDDDDVPNPDFKLKKLEVVFYGGFRGKLCGSSKKISGLAPDLETLSVTYLSVAKQLRRFDLRNCKGKLEDMISTLGDTFDDRLGIENPHLVIEGTEDQGRVDASLMLLLRILDMIL